MSRAALLMALAVTAGAALLTRSSAADPGPTWSEIGLPAAQAIAVDPIRNRLLLFTEGSHRQSLTALSLSDSTWAEIVPDGPPPPSYAVQWAMFDSLRDRALVSYGVTIGGSALMEISFANGPRWRSLGSAVQAYEPGVAFDPRRRTLFWFGGGIWGGNRGPRFSNVLSAVSIDTGGVPHWVPTSGSAPSIRAGASMIYDSARDRLILYGGLSYPDSFAMQSQIWECTLADTTWRLIGTGPPQRGHQAIYDPIGDRMLVFGDSSATRGLWSYSFGSTPAPIPQASGPAPRAGAKLTYDPLGRRLILHGGVAPQLIGVERAQNDVWALPLEGPASWTDLAPGSLSPPGAPSDWLVAYDDRNDRTMVVTWASESELWWLDPNGRWERERVPGLPLLRSTKLVFDRARSRVLLFGGSTGSRADNLVWELPLKGPGTRAWNQVLTVGPIPQSRYGHGATYDSLGDRLIISGGSGGAARRSTWALSFAENPPHWEELPPPPTPDGAIFYDVLRDRLVLDSNGIWILGRVGEWQSMGVEGLGGRSTIYDPSRDELMANSTYELERLHLSGLVSISRVPCARDPGSSGALAFDSRRDRWVLVTPRAYVMQMTCAPGGSAPSILPSAVVGQPYHHIVEVGPSGSSRRYSETGRDLPRGLGLDANTGEISGTPIETGWNRCVVTATDGSCRYYREFRIYVYPCLTATTPFACLRGEDAVRIGVQIARNDTARIGRWKAKLRLPPELALAGPCAPESCASIQPGNFFSPGDGPTLLRAERAWDGSIDIEGQGPCGTGLGGTLFTVALRKGVEDGVGVPEVLGATLFPCSGEAPHPVANCGAMTRVSIDARAPAAITDLGAGAAGGGGRDGTLPIRLAFTAPAGAAQLRVYRAGFGNSPEYDDPLLPDSSTGVAPTLPNYPPGPTWVLTGASLASPVDETPVRDVYSYAAFLLDSCGNVSSVSNLTPGIPNYRLGDFWSSAGECVGDNAVQDIDLSLLRDHYGARLADPGPDPLSCLDIGPTTTGGLAGRPLTDNVIDFEDLVIFAMSFGTSTSTAASGGAATNRVRLVVPPSPPSGGSFVAPIELNAAGDLRAIQFQLQYDESVIELTDATGGPLLGAQAGLPFVAVASPRNVDVALCGANLSGAGEVARLSFRVVGEGTAGLRLAGVEGRDALNRHVAVQPDEDEVVPTRVRTSLSPAYPNPVTALATFRLGLAEAGTVRLGVFDLQGRRVRDLLRGPQLAGERLVTWDGRGDRGEVQPAGLYVARLDAGDARVVRRFVFAP